MATSQTAQSSYQNFAAQMEQQYNIPKGLLQWQIGAESGYNPTAKNPNSSAYGIAQFTNATADWRNVNVNDPYDSIQGAASYMAYLKQKTGSWMGALNSYGTTKDNPAKTAQAQSILNADNANPQNIISYPDGQGGQLNLVYDTAQQTNTGSGTQGKQTNSTGTGNGSGGGTNFNNMLLIALFFVFGLALVILAFMNTDAGKKTVSFIATKGIV